MDCEPNSKRKKDKSMVQISATVCVLTILQFFTPIAAKSGILLHKGILLLPRTAAMSLAVIVQKTKSLQAAHKILPYSLSVKKKSKIEKISNMDIIKNYKTMKYIPKNWADFLYFLFLASIRKN